MKVKDDSMRKSNPLLVKVIQSQVGVFFLTLGLAAPSFAMVSLKSVQVKSPSEFNLTFDEKISEAQVDSEFVNDIFQITLKNISVYPAKIVPVSGRFFSKIFAYQYSPKLVRCRFTLRGKANDLKRKIKISVKGSVIGVKLDPAFVQAVSQVAPKVSAVKETASSLPEAKVVEVAPATDALEEQALLQNVMKGTESPTAEGQPLEVQSIAPPKDLMNAKSHPETLHESESSRLTAGKPLPAIWPVVAKLSFVVLLACLFAAFVKKAKTTPTGKRWFSAIGKLAKNGLIKNREMIQVVSTHHLDPKKSLAVVKVAGRLMLLGVSNEAINLITQLPGDSGDASLLDLENDPGFAQSELADDPMFADLLGSEKLKSPIQTTRGAQGAYALGASALDAPSLVPTARSRIKNRLEGLKQL